MSNSITHYFAIIAKLYWHKCNRKCWHFTQGEEIPTVWNFLPNPLASIPLWGSNSNSSWNMSSLRSRSSSLSSLSHTFHSSLLMYPSPPKGIQHLVSICHLVNACQAHSDVAVGRRVEMLLPRPHGLWGRPSSQEESNKVTKALSRGLTQHQSLLQRLFSGWIN